MRTGKPTVAISGWAIAMPGGTASQLPAVAASAEQAVDEALRLAEVHGT